MVVDPWRKKNKAVALNVEPTFRDVTGKFQWSQNVTGADHADYKKAVDAWRKNKLIASAGDIDKKRFNEELRKVTPCGALDVGCHAGKFGDGITDMLKKLAILALIGVAIYAAMPTLVKGLRK